MPRGLKTRETGELLLSKITQKSKPSPLHFAALFLWEPHGLGSGPLPIQPGVPALTVRQVLSVLWVFAAFWGLQPS